MWIRLKLIRVTLTGILMGLSLVSCTQIGNFAERRADKAAYEIIRETEQAQFGKVLPFSVNQASRSELDAIVENTDSNLTHLSLSDTLAIAMLNSRDYQRNKETLYLNALDLSGTRRDYGTIFSGGGDASYTETSYTSPDSRERFGSGTIGAGISRILASGATIGINFSQNLTRYISSPSSRRSDNALTATLVQPLLNGFGPLMAREGLRQAERRMIYAARDFRRYRQQFVISIASTYYDLIQSRDELYNARRNYESAITNCAQIEAYAEAHRIAEFEASDSRLRKLRAANRWTSAQANYESQLENFREDLGLPIDSPIEPDPDELKKLASRGLVPIDIDMQEAVRIAFSNRLDLATQQNRVEDKERDLRIALQKFLPSLDLTYTYKSEFDKSAASGSPLLDNRQTFGLDLNLPLNWTPLRNAYRRSQIDLLQERRDLEEMRAQIRSNIHNIWRQLENTRKVYKNRLLSIELAHRRVENASLQLNMGRALARDLLDAQDDLLSARNDTTSSLVDYTIQRLRFWDAIERLQINSKGMWNEIRE